HARGDALYADALALRKDYSSEEGLTARPTAWCSSGYRFARGEVMQADYQVTYREHEPVITYERDRLGRRKLVSEPFKDGPIYWYHYEPYSILNREELDGQPFFRYCGFFDHWQFRPRGGRGYAAYFDDFISYLTAYAIYPRQVEMLVKSGPWEPLSDLIYARKKNVAAMCWEETDPRKAFGLNKRELSWFLGVQPPLEVLAIRNYVLKHWGERWDLPFCMDFRNLWGCQVKAMEVLRFLGKRHLTPGRFLRYLDRVSEQTDDRYATLFGLYRDYWEAAYALGRCMEHGKVLWPEDLHAAHDSATEELADKQAREEKKRRAASLKERRLKYEFELDGLKIVFPATSLAIRREGKALCHCVGGYAERHMNGVTTILFLRRTDAPATPYITLEMDGNQLRQIHGYDNERSACPENPGRVSPRTIHKAFLDTWLRWLRDGSKRNDDGTPKVPRQKAAAGKVQARTA
ncbi:PcfJ domain-containing protein, partial [Intestinimonas aquisgranensis]